jgi:hypothetical protein
MKAPDCPKYRKLREASEKAWHNWKKRGRSRRSAKADEDHLESFYINSARAVLNHQQSCPLCQEEARE